MSIKLEIPSYLQPFANDTEVAEINGSTIGECLNELVKQFADMKKMLFTRSGKLHGYVGIYLNGEDAYPNELAKPVKDGDKLLIMYIVGGG